MKAVNENYYEKLISLILNFIQQICSDVDFMKGLDLRGLKIMEREWSRSENDFIF